MKTGNFWLIFGLLFCVFVLVLFNLPEEVATLWMMLIAGWQIGDWFYNIAEHFTE